MKTNIIVKEYIVNFNNLDYIKCIINVFGFISEKFNINPTIQVMWSYQWYDEEILNENYLMLWSTIHKTLISNKIYIINKLISLENQYKNDLIIGDLQINYIKFVLTFIGPDSEIAIKMSRSLLNINSIFNHMLSDFIAGQEEISIWFLFKLWLSEVRFIIVMYSNNLLFLTVYEFILFYWSNRAYNYNILLFSSNWTLLKIN